MIKTLKGKVIAGVVAVGLLTTTGVALGSTDAGANLKVWFDGLFGNVAADVQSESEAYLQGGLAGLGKELKGLEKDATDKMIGTRDIETAESTTKINTKAKEYIESIESKQAELEGYMDGEFGKLKEEADKRIHTAGTEFSASAHKDMAAYTKLVGTMQQKSVQVELQAVTDKAITDIDAAIKAAKAQLTAKLNEKATATTEEIKAMVDKEVGNIRYFITSMTNFMVQEQQDLIAARAQKFEDEAMKQMADLVGGI